MNRFFLSLSISVLLVLSIGTGAAYAQVYKFELSNPSIPIAVGSNFDVKVFINTGGQAVNSGDALLIFDPTKVLINSAADGQFFEYFSEGALGGFNNKYLVSAWENPGHEKTAATDTLFSTLNLKAVASGSSTLKFDCTAGTDADTNINRSSDSKDIADCSALTLLTLNIGGGVTGTPTASPGPTAGPTVPAATSTPIPTNTPTPTPTAKPTNVPTATKAVTPTLYRAGNMSVTMTAVGVGVILTIVGVLAIL